MNNQSGFGVVCFCIGVFFGLVIGIGIASTVWRYEALRKGVGEYDGKTGHFRLKQLTDSQQAR